MLTALRSLGYLGGSGAVVEPASVEKELAVTGHDPKDLVDVSMSAREIQNGFYDRGEQKILRFFETTATPAQDPSTARLWAAAHQNYAKIWIVRRLRSRGGTVRLGRRGSSYDPARWEPHLRAESGSTSRGSREGGAGHSPAIRARTGSCCTVRSRWRSTPRGRGAPVPEEVVQGAASDENLAKALVGISNARRPSEEAALTAYVEAEQRSLAASSGEID